ncbi:MAG TPA: hypothetical protein VM163_00325 [bacterium]|nr:hypothetical protein [bacterium]
MSAVLAGFIAYLIIVLFIGLLTAKHNKTQADYLIGGRRLNPWVIAFSERASGESAWLLLGMTGAALSVGLGETWTALGCVLGIIISWLFIARKLREDSGKYDALTLPEYFTEKFSKDGKSIQIIASVIIIFFFTFYIAAQFSGAGKVLNVTFGIPNFWGVLVGAGVILLYTMLGGFFAVAWTDLVQGIIMLGTLVVLPIVGIIELSEAGKLGTLSISQALVQEGADKASWVGGAAALVLALTTKELVFSMVSYAWGGLGASFGPIIVLSLYWRKLNKQGVIAGMLAGSLTTFIWKNISTLQSVIPERLAGYVVAFCAVIIVTLVTKPNPALARR